MLIFSLLFNVEIFVVFIMMVMLKESLFMDEEFNFYIKMTEINFWMVVLVLILYLMMLNVEFKFKLSLNLLFILLYYIMIVNDFLVFFYLYEMVFIFIMFVIMLLGYSYERLMASFLMMFYSFLFSSPILIMLLLFDYTFLMKNWLNYSLFINYFLVGSFMVKFPVFGFHHWLPVAHVEASTIGSMLLAGVLLKLGSLGMMYVIMYLSFMVKFHWMSVGVLLMMLIILFLSDLKMMIAYSSIAHMSMVFYIMMTGVLVGKKGVIMMMFYHGFISPLMFWIVGSLAWWKTRSLMVVKMLSFSYSFLLLLFLLIILNMGFPPFLGFLSEILMMKSLINLKLILIIMIFSVLFSCYYNVYLFWCFNNLSGLLFKIDLLTLDVFIFLIFSIMLNF